MIKRITYLLILALSSPILAQDYSWDDNAQFIQPNYSGIYATCRMDISQAGEKVVLGHFRDVMSIDQHSISSTKPIGVFLAKYSANDSVMWLNKIAEADELSTTTMTPIISSSPTLDISVNGDIYIGLSYRDSLLIDGSLHFPDNSVPGYSRAILLKYNQNGEFINHITFGGTCFNSLNRERVFTDIQENTYVLIGFGNDVWETTDSCECIVDTDTLVTDGMQTFLAKYNSNADLLWLTSFEASNAENIEVVDDDIYVTGTSYGAQDITFLDYALEYPSNIDYGGYIVKLDTSGVFHWAKYLGVNGWDSNIQLHDLHAVSNNDILVMGRSFTQSVPNRVYLQDAPTLIGTPSGSQDAFVVCYDSLGNVKWSDIIVSTSGDWFFDAVSDSDKNIFIGGTFSSSQLELDQDTLISYGSYETFITAYDSLGTHLWAKSAGGTGSDMTKGLKMDSQENMYLLGSTASQPIHFGEHTYNLTGNTAQIFMSKLVPHNIGLIEQKTNGFATIYPNPNTGAFYIQSEEALTRLEIYNLLGEKVYSKDFEISLKDFEVNTTLTTGLYFVVLHTEQGTYSIKKMLIN